MTASWEEIVEERRKERRGEERRGQERRGWKKKTAKRKEKQEHIFSARYSAEKKKKKKNIFIINIKQFRNGKFPLLPYRQVIALANRWWCARDESHQLIPVTPMSLPDLLPSLAGMQILGAAAFLAQK